MRVTKLVREYVTEVIEKKYPVIDLPEYTEAHENAAMLEERINDAAFELVKDMLADLASDYPLPEDWEMKNNMDGRRAVCLSNWGSNLSAKNEEHRRAQRTARESKIKDILLTLELGGTKADLAKMLEEA